MYCLSLINVPAVYSVTFLALHGSASSSSSFQRTPLSELIDRGDDVLERRQTNTGALVVNQTAIVLDACSHRPQDDPATCFAQIVADITASALPYCQLKYEEVNACYVFNNYDAEVCTSQLNDYQTCRAYTALIYQYCIENYDYYISPYLSNCANTQLQVIPEAPAVAASSVSLVTSKAGNRIPGTGGGAIPSISIPTPSGIIPPFSYNLPTIPISFPTITSLVLITTTGLVTYVTTDGTSLVQATSTGIVTSTQYGPAAAAPSSPSSGQRTFYSTSTSTVVSCPPSIPTCSAAGSGSDSIVYSGVFWPPPHPEGMCLVGKRVMVLRRDEILVKDWLNDRML